MPVPAQSLPTIGLPNSTEDAKTRSCVAELQSLFSATGFLTFPIGDGDHVARIGTATITFDGGSPSLGGTTVTHGMTGTPVCVLCTPTQIDGTTRGGEPKAPSLSIGTIGGTTFQIYGTSVGVSSNTTTIYWLAIV